MSYITSALGLQARSRRNARNAARDLTLRRSLAASRATHHALVQETGEDPHAAAVSTSATTGRGPNSADGRVSTL